MIFIASIERKERYRRFFCVKSECSRDENIVDTEFPFKIKEGNLRVSVEHTKNQTFNRFVIDRGGLVMEIHKLAMYQRGGNFFDQTLFLLPVGVSDDLQRSRYHLHVECGGVGVQFK